MNSRLGIMPFAFEQAQVKKPMISTSVMEQSLVLSVSSAGHSKPAWKKQLTILEQLKNAREYYIE